MYKDDLESTQGEVSPLSSAGGDSRGHSDRDKDRDKSGKSREKTKGYLFINLLFAD